MLVDERNSNRWRLCADFPIPKRLAATQWLRDARIGVSAATGESTDAHDVLGLETFADASGRRRIPRWA